MAFSVGMKTSIHYREKIKPEQIGLALENDLKVPDRGFGELGIRTLGTANMCYACKCGHVVAFPNPAS
jgi:hypothetical protein